MTADGLGERTGTAVATGIGGLQTLDLAHEHLFSKGIDRMSPLWITMLIPNMGAAMVSMEYGFRGPSSTVTTACAASSMAIGDAVGTIRDGRADVMVAGGSEAPITPIGVGGFYAMRAISQRNDDPETASRPFDAGRDGFVIGEGSTIVVIEELEHARARGARIYGEIMGYGCTADAHHFTEPDPTGVNPARAMRLALEEAEMQPSAIDYINAHGTSTPVGDAAETRVIKMVLGEERAYEVPVSSTKSMTGHMLGAAGSTELAITALALCRDVAAADDQPVRARSRVRPGLRPERGAARRRRPRRPLERLRLRRPQRVARSSSAGTRATAAASPDGLAARGYAISSRSRALRSTRCAVSSSRASRPTITSSQPQTRSPSVWSSSGPATRRRTPRRSASARARATARASPVTRPT